MSCSYQNNIFLTVVSATTILEFYEVTSELLPTHEIQLGVFSRVRFPKGRITCRWKMKCQDNWPKHPNGSDNFV